MKKDIVQKIDEFLPFIAGAMAGAMAGYKEISKAEPSDFNEILKKVVYHPKEKDWKKAVELVIKDERLDKKTAKKLKKFIYQHS